MTVHGIGKWYVEVEKQAYWRGNPHSWVNRYVMSGADPTSADAISVMTGLAGIESDLYPTTAAGGGVGLVEARAYASTGYSPFATVPYNTSKASGTATGFAGGGVSPAPTWAPTLETCLLITTPVIGLTTSGKPITLRKYMRGLNWGSAEDSGPGVIPTEILDNINTLVRSWFSGVGGTSYTVQPTSPLRVTGGPPTAHAYLVNHQIPRGRKRKPLTVTTSSGTTISIKKFGSPGDSLGGDLGDIPVL